VIRAFIAIDIAPQTINRIIDLTHQLEPRISGIRWLGSENLHLTLKFLGAVEESKIDLIEVVLTESLRLFQRFTINAKGLGVFPNPRQARVLWIGLLGSQLISLQQKVESALTPFGFAPEPKSFTPHVTIGRWRQDHHHADRTLKQELEKWREYDFGATTVEEVGLFQSDLKPTGAIYRRLKVVTLKSDPV
jgi:RNA 2',3'-cyclic 3'-phosphodiesterase